MPAAQRDYPPPAAPHGYVPSAAACSYAPPADMLPDGPYHNEVYMQPPLAEQPDDTSGEYSLDAHVVYDLLAMQNGGHNMGFHS